VATWSCSAGSCWAFAAGGVDRRPAHDRDGGALVSLSEQEIVDCDRGDNDLGCAGGEPNSAMEWVAGSPATAASPPDRTSYHPYVGSWQGECRSAQDRQQRGHDPRRPGGGATARPRWSAPRRVSPSPRSSTAPAAPSSSARAGCSRAPAGTNRDHAVTAVGYGAEPASTGSSRTRGARRDTCGWRGASITGGWRRDFVVDEEVCIWSEVVSAASHPVAAGARGRGIGEDAR